MDYTLLQENPPRRRTEILESTKNTCLRCGVKNRSFAFNKAGKLYVLYLRCVKIFSDPNETINYLIPLCQRCHHWYISPRKDTPQGVRDWAFIGEIARLVIEQEARGENRRDIS